MHFGHLRLALEVRQQLQLEAVRLVPLYSPPHREAPVAAAAQRLRMLQLAVADTDELVVDDCELARKGTSYTIETVRLLRVQNPDRPLCLMVGMDAFQALDTWRDWSALLDYVHLVIVDRAGQVPDIRNPALEQLYTNHRADDTAVLTEATAGAIIKVNAPLLEISSTAIRDHLRRGDSIKYLLPDAVLSYIEQESLYR